MDDKYNGWTNYETWLANLWLDNGVSGEMWREEAEQYIADHEGAEDLRDDAVTHIAAAIKAEHDDDLGEIIPEAAGLFQDLLNASLARVNWREIAEHYVDDAMAEAAE